MRQQNGRTGERVIEGTAIAECPVSYITALSLAAVEMAQTNRVLGECGGSLYGPDAGLWPAWWADALVTVQAAVAAEERARFD